MNGIKYWISLLCVIVFGVGVLSSSAQETTPSGPGVRMLVTVEGGKGKNPPSVDAADVLVYEGKARDKVTSWIAAQSDHAQLELFILLDDSSGSSLDTQLESIRDFISSQPTTVKVGVAYMQNGTGAIAQNLTDDHAQAAKSVRLPLGVAGLNASPYFSLSDLIKKWPASDARREVLMVSDGIDRYYETADTQDPYLQTAIQDAQRAGIVVYGIYNPGVGHVGHSYWLNYWGQMYLSRLAYETGGESYYIGTQGPAVNFQPYFDDFDQRVKNQYVLTFIPQPEKKSGMRPIKLRCELPNVDLVGADQVYVPASE